MLFISISIRIFILTNVTTVKCNKKCFKFVNNFSVYKYICLQLASQSYTRGNLPNPRKRYFKNDNYVIGVY